MRHLPRPSHIPGAFRSSACLPIGRPVARYRLKSRDASPLDPLQPSPVHRLLSHALRCPRSMARKKAVAAKVRPKRPAAKKRRLPLRQSPSVQRPEVSPLQGGMPQHRVRVKVRRGARSRRRKRRHPRNGRRGESGAKAQTKHVPLWRPGVVRTDAQRARWPIDRCGRH